VTSCREHVPVVVPFRASSRLAWWSTGPRCGPTDDSSAPCWSVRRVPTHGGDLGTRPPMIWRPCSIGASQCSRLPIQVRCPGFQAFHQRSTTIRYGEATWQCDANLSPTSPTRSKITPAEVLASQPGHRREVTRACRLSANRVWRAANGINPHDSRPTGERPPYLVAPRHTQPKMITHPGHRHE
jgi:hypothetical protein